MLKTQTKKITAFMSVVTMLFSMLLYFPGGMFSTYFGLKASAATITPSQPSGEGTSTSPYKIGTAGQLYWFAAYVNCGNIYANAVLTANIVVNVNVLKTDGTPNCTDFTSWTPIGNSSNNYTGTFDGQNHTISGLYFNNNANFVGLFGYIETGGTIKNVGVVDSYFNGKWNVGGVCGASNGEITNCYNTGTVSGTYSVGGVCGLNGGTITNCYNTGNVSASGQFANVGGVCGYNDGAITNCYNTGEVSCSDNIGGVCGGNEDTITNCYYDIDKYSGNAVGGGAGTDTDVEGRPTSDFTNGTVCGLVGYHSHKINGFCSLCGGGYESAVYNEIANRYEISNAGQLYWFADYVNSGNTNANAALTSDIIVNESVINANGELNTGSFKSWIPIGNTSSNTYTGIFNGRKNTISGLYFNNENTNYVGLFGCSQGTIKNVGVVDSYFKGQNSVGGVCGANGSSSIITNCYNKGEVSGTDYVGGVCGYNYGTIKNCYNASKVSGSDNIGGVCGGNEDTITNCYFNNDIYGGNAVGYNDGGTVTDAEGKTPAQFRSGEVCEAVGYHSHQNGICALCVHVENGVMICGQSVTLDGTIGMNVYVAANDDCTTWTASFNDKAVEKPEKDEKGLYKFTYQVAAKDMADNIIFSLSNGDSVTVSVKDYLEALDTSESTGLAELVTAMETYGNAASEFFKTDGNVPAPAEDVTVDDLSGYAFTKKETFPAGISYYGSSLILESETTVRHYFKLDAGKNIDEFTFTIDGNTVIPGEKSGYYYIDVKNISAENLGVGHTVKIGDTEVIRNYSALSYARAVLNSTTADDNLKNLVKALYLYNQKANAYGSN